MREEHRHMRDEGWDPRGGRPGRPGRSGGRPGRPEWGDPGDFPSGPGRPGRGPRGHDVRGGRRGEGPWGGPGPFGRGGPFGGPDDFGFRLREEFARRGGPRRGRARRGDVRAAILDLLDEGQPWNGYQIIQEISARTSGVWRPSAGSVYPALQQLEDEGLIAPEGEGRRRRYTLTDEGRAYTEAHADELRSSWDAVAGMTDEVAFELGDIFRQVMMAVTEVRRAGSPSQIEQARGVLTEARRSMYRILADDETASGTTASGTTGTRAGAAPDDEPADDDPADAEPQDLDALQDSTGEGAE
ncbi:MAG TPA: PadR family transcriptional regulator [Trebonia sp.]|jgi:DNA-binding PadR family transcriptional regulator